MEGEETRGYRENVELIVDWKEWLWGEEILREVLMRELRQER